MNKFNKLHVLVTRPGVNGQELAARIEAGGDQAMILPVIDFIATDNHVLQPAIADLGYQDWWCFVSPRAVFYTLPLLRQFWPILPRASRIAAVGLATRSLLIEAGYPVAVCPEKTWGSESLLAHVELQQLSGKKIALLRGKGGREMLEETFSERGAQVTSIVAYERILPSVDMRPFLHALEKGDIHVIVCTSFESVENLKKLFGTATLEALPLIVVSERIKTLAQRLGFQTIWIAENASHEAIWNTLEKKRKAICLMKEMKEMKQQKQ